MSVVVTDGTVGFRTTKADTFRAELLRVEDRGPWENSRFPDKAPKDTWVWFCKLYTFGDPNNPEGVPVIDPATGEQAIADPRTTQSLYDGSGQGQAADAYLLIKAFLGRTPKAGEKAEDLFAEAIGNSAIVRYDDDGRFNKKSPFPAPRMAAASAEA